VARKKKRGRKGTPICSTPYFPASTIDGGGEGKKEKTRHPLTLEKERGKSPRPLPIFLKAARTEREESPRTSCRGKKRKMQAYLWILSCPTHPHMKKKERKKKKKERHEKEKKKRNLVWWSAHKCLLTPSTSKQAGRGKGEDRFREPPQGKKRKKEGAPSPSSPFLYSCKKENGRAEKKKRKEKKERIGDEGFLKRKKKR